MKAMLITRHGPPDVLTCVEVPTPAPRADEVLVRHQFIGVNFVDTQHRAGLYYPVRLPLIPGVEAAGVVEAVDAEVSEFRAGDRVAYAGTMVGVYAEYGAVPANRLVRVPDGLSLDLAAASLMQGTTAQLLTTQIYPLSCGETALIYAAASGVGALLVQLAKGIGATVIGVTSSAEKANIVRSLGADHVLLYDDPAFVEAIEHLTGGQGVHVVYDGVGGALIDRSLKALRTRGHLIEFGQAGGQPMPVDISRLSGITGSGNRGSLSITWASAGDYLSSTDALQHCAASVFHLVQREVLRIPIACVYPLEAAAQAHHDLESRTVSGKLLLAVG